MLLGARQAMWGGGAAPGPTPAYWGLCFTAEQANSTVAMTANGSAPSVNLLYSTDAVNWSPFVVGTTTVTLASVGDKVWLKAGTGGNTRFGSSTSNYNTFSLSGLVAASGSIMSLLDGEEEENFTLPANYAFGCLFYNCGTLTAAPSLPATTLKNNCYAWMFRNCTSLTAAPELNATTLTSNCYIQMFRGCTSLTVVPELPAETLTSGCYSFLFDGCSSLAAVRVRCTKLNAVNSYNWLNNVSASGTLYCPTAQGTNETITRSANVCPSGWTVINTDAA